jgi:hypothetical protein
MSVNQPVWWCAHDGKKLGPFSAAELHGMALGGKVLPTQRVWRQGLERWVPAMMVCGLFPPNGGTGSNKAMPMVDLWEGQHHAATPPEPSGAGVRATQRREPAHSGLHSTWPGGGAQTAMAAGTWPGFARKALSRQLVPLPEFEASGPPTEPASPSAFAQPMGGAGAIAAAPAPVSWQASRLHALGWVCVALCLIGFVFFY